MTKINGKRVLIGGLVGFAGWVVLDLIIGFGILMPRYPKAQEAGFFLQQPRYPFFMPVWYVVILLISWILAWFYASVREAWAPGPKTALKLGCLVGFAMAFPMNFAMAAWSPAPRIFALGWTIDLWIGPVIATLLAGWLYREH
jgi:hypothetical protein